MQNHNRRSIRLKNHDYSQSGAYFVTICTQDRKCLFGSIMDDEMILNDYGKIIEEKWLQIVGTHPEIDLGAYIIMPNHIHGIIEINPLKWELDSSYVEK